MNKYLEQIKEAAFSDELEKIAESGNVYTNLVRDFKDKLESVASSRDQAYTNHNDTYAGEVAAADTERGRLVGKGAGIGGIIGGLGGALAAGIASRGRSVPSMLGRAGLGALAGGAGGGLFGALGGGAMGNHNANKILTPEYHQSLNSLENTYDDSSLMDLGSELSPIEFPYDNEEEYANGYIAGLQSAREMY